MTAKADPHRSGRCIAQRRPECVIGTRRSVTDPLLDAAGTDLVVATSLILEVAAKTGPPPAIAVSPIADAFVRI
jgi:hypothetical protein